MVPTESRIQRFCLKRKRVEWLRQPRFKLPRNIAWLAHEGNNRTQEKYLEKLTWLSHYDVANYQVDFHIIRFTALTLVWPKQQVLLERFVALWRQIRIPKARAFVWLEFDWQGTSSNIREEWNKSAFSLFVPNCGTVFIVAIPGIKKEFLISHLVKIWSLCIFFQIPLLWKNTYNKCYPTKLLHCGKLHLQLFPFLHNKLRMSYKNKLVNTLL